MSHDPADRIGGCFPGPPKTPYCSSPCERRTQWKPLTPETTCNLGPLRVLALNPSLTTCRGNDSHKFVRIPPPATGLKARMAYRYRQHDIRSRDRCQKGCENWWQRSPRNRQASRISVIPVLLSRKTGLAD